ncbi:hypothetical protein ACLB2K_071042 [Fragaria x ananassa]
MDSGTVGVREKETTSSYGMQTIIGSMVMFLLMVVFVGYTMIWIMMPTNTYYLHWLPDIHAKTDSTYFGQQGAGILVYTFPILFTATLGCLLLHTRNKTADDENQSGVMKSLWKRPVLVKGPLGIVSWIELSFLAMFIALLVWSISSYLHGMFATISLQAAAKREHVASKVRKYSTNARPSWKHLSSLSLLPGGTRVFNSAARWPYIRSKYQMLKWEKIGISNVAGEVALLAGLVMWATSIPRIRGKIFELFFYTHHLYIVFIVFFVFHVGFSYACIMLPGFYLFMIDRVLRFLQSQQRIRLVSARVLPCEAVELSFSKIPGLSYSPTSMMFLNVPAISKLQWHPFTITSSSNMDPDNLSVVIKSEGSWTQNLYQKFASSSTCPIDRLEVSVEGPYGPASNNLRRHDTIVMVSGGSGITPMISIIRELLSQANDSGKKTPHVLLITAFKKSLDLTMLDLILPPSGTNLDISCLQLQIEAYVTRENQPATHNQKPLQTIWFKPDPLDSPVSAVLGRNSWLSLGVIISMSFIIFLVLMGILTRYYIYPIDHNSNLIYSASYRSALNILLLCVSIAATATAVFLWNQKQNSKETGQIQGIDTPPQITTSPSARFYNADRELESLPHQSFVQSTKVHYGTRPDLQKILSDCEGSSIGVLVSGPRKMRQEVAAVCSSPSAHNLHYHSMSFSW